MTYAEIIADIRTYLDEATASDWTATEVTRNITQAFHEVVAAAMEVFEDYYIVQYTTDTVASQQEYGLPTDFLKMRRVEINYDTADSNSVAQRAFPVNIDQIRGRLDNSTIGPRISGNPMYFIIGDNIGFLPVPQNTETTDGIKIWYIRDATSPTVFTTNEPDIPYHNRFCPLISWRATANLLRKGQQESVEADKFDVKVENGIARMKQFLEDRIAEETKRVIDVSESSLDFGSPY